MRETLRQRGVLPPVKPKLNRKKFAQETIKEFEDFGRISDMAYLYEAIGWMLPSLMGRTVTPEQVGVLKMLRLAMDIKKYLKNKQDQGETTYDTLELYETVVAPIRDL